MELLNKILTYGQNSKKYLEALESEKECDYDALSGDAINILDSLNEELRED